MGSGDVLRSPVEQVPTLPMRMHTSSTQPHCCRRAARSCSYSHPLFFLQLLGASCVSREAIRKQEGGFRLIEGPRRVQDIHQESTDIRNDHLLPLGVVHYTDQSNVKIVLHFVTLRKNPPPNLTIPSLPVYTFWLHLGECPKDPNEIRLGICVALCA